MIPLRDHEPAGSFPMVNYLLIGINIAVFLFMATLSDVQLEDFIYTYSLIPFDTVHFRNLHTVLTSMFLHGGIGHIAGNMLFLHIFGDNLEDAFGHVRYLAYYLLAGLGGSILQIATDPLSTVPNLGASGAISGMLGGYLLLFPRHRIDVLIPFGFFLSRTTVPASFMLVYWFLGQFLLGFGSLGISAGGGVAYFAHIGGFIAGLALAWPLKRRARRDLEFMGYY